MNINPINRITIFIDSDISGCERILFSQSLARLLSSKEDWKDDVYFLTSNYKELPEYKNQSVLILDDFNSEDILGLVESKRNFYNLVKPISSDVISICGLNLYNRYTIITSCEDFTRFLDNLKDPLCDSLFYRTIIPVYINLYNESISFNVYKEILKDKSDKNDRIYLDNKINLNINEILHSFTYEESIILIQRILENNNIKDLFKKIEDYFIPDYSDQAKRLYLLRKYNIDPESL